MKAIVAYIQPFMLEKVTDALRVQAEMRGPPRLPGAGIRERLCARFTRATFLC